jgi:hypothetical protein
VGAGYIVATHLHHRIVIYGEEGSYSFQIALKRKGINYFDYKKRVQVNNKKLEQVKELGYICLKGLTTNDESEKELLRNIYKTII